MIKVIKIAQSETVYGLFQNVGEPERMVYHEAVSYTHLSSAVNERLGTK